MKLATFIRLIKDPYYLLSFFLRHTSKFIPNDKLFIQLQYFAITHEKLNLINPTSFNEKLQWLKLYDRKPNYTEMVDKIAVRKYIERIIGEDKSIPLIAKWKKTEEIDFDSLPKQFVLKCNHNSGLGLYICKDKYFTNKHRVLNNLKKGLKQNYFLIGREWPYKDVKREIFAEKYIGDNLIDYRFYCFNGEPKLIYVYSNESKSNGNKPEPAHCDIFDINWNPMPYHQRSMPKGNIQKPRHINEMIDYARKLSSGTPFLRVDFYDEDRLYIGELTLFPGGGIAPFYPNEWNLILGKWLQLPNSKSD